MNELTLAIIGTAGRDKTKPMTRSLWDWMVRDAAERVVFENRLVSGGAAWADHLAVALYISGAVDNLTLHLPAPFDGTRFVGPDKSAASAANYYHGLFSRVLGINTLNEIAMVLEGGAVVTYEPALHGYSGMFARNAKVARSAEMLAYTFGAGDVPADGGTKDTWDKCRGKRTHVTLPV